MTRTPDVNDPTLVTVVSRPDLTASIRAVEPREGEPETPYWRIQVVNQGTDVARNVRIVDGSMAS